MSGTTKQTVEVDVPDGRFAFAMTCAIEPDEYGDHGVYWPNGAMFSYFPVMLAERGVEIPTPPRGFRKGDTVRFMNGSVKYLVLDVLDNGEVLRISNGTRLGSIHYASRCTLLKAVDA